MHHIVAGFLPLMDSAILVAAKVCGFAEEEGIDLSLVRETSWANIRDRMAVGHFDAAHMLAPMPIASSLGLLPVSVKLIAPMALGLGGNAVTVSRTLWDKMTREGDLDVTQPSEVGAALKKVIEKQTVEGKQKLCFGVVHPHSGHNLELRYWLHACGINPDVDIEIIVLPPPLMADALALGRLDGFCVGEPWNTVAVQAGQGRIATVKSAIWHSSPEKVLALRTSFFEKNPESAHKLIRALYKAASWCSKLENREKLAKILSDKEFLGLENDKILSGLKGTLSLDGNRVENLPDFFEVFEKAATFPWQSHALWFYSQMVKWHMIKHDESHVEKVLQSYRPDIYRAALAELDVNLPQADSKIEGALVNPVEIDSTKGSLIMGPDGFFDKKIFNPDCLDDYLQL